MPSIRQPMRPVDLGSSYKILRLDGEDGNYASTPDSENVSIDGDTTLIAYIDIDITAAPNEIIMAQYSTVSGAFVDCAFMWYINHNSSLMGLILSSTGTNQFTGNSSTIDFSNPLWVRVSTSLATDDYSFFTSNDPRETAYGDVSWTSAGVAEDIFTPTSVYNSSLPILIGSRSGDQPLEARGDFYHVFLINGTDPSGTLGAEMNPNADYEGGSSWTSSSGEVWTLTGAAHIVSIP